MDDLEQDDSEERVDLGSLLVCPGHLGFHPACECTGGLQSACDEDDACEEEPEVGVLGREGIGAVFAVVLGDDLDDCEDKGDEWVLENLCPCSLHLKSESGRPQEQYLGLGCKITYLEPSERTTFDNRAFPVLERELVEVFLPICTFGANPFEK